MKKRILILIEVAALAVVVLALATHPATDQSWLAYLWNVARRWSPLE